MPLASMSVLERLSVNSAAAQTWKPTLTRVHAMHSVLRSIRAQGGRVSENIEPIFGGGVAYPGHSVEGSHYVILWCNYHNRHHSFAADINYGPTGPTEQPFMDAVSAYAILKGMRVLSGPGVPDHENHAHIDYTPVSRSNVVFWNPKKLAWPGEIYPVTFSSTLRRNQESAAVKHLQSLLRELGYAIVVDGKFGPATEKAVKAFQGKYALKIDGIAGPATETALVHRYCLKKIAE